MTRIWVVFLVLCFLGVSGSSGAKRRKGRRSKKPQVGNTTPPSSEDDSSLPSARVTSGAAASRLPQDRVTKIAVLELDSLGISSELMRNLEMLLQRSIGTIGKVEVIPTISVQMALQGQKKHEARKCGGGPQCAVSVGRVVGADVVVFGTIGAMGQSFSLNIRAMDVTTGREIARQQSTISGDRDLLIPSLRMAAYELIAPERIVGSLQIEINVAGVEIEIDGKSVGTTPLESAVENLTPGQHLVVLKRPGYSEFQKEFTIRPFETARLNLTLEKAQ